MLRITTEKFHEQVVEAIASLKEIYQLNNVPLSPELSRDLITQQLLTDPTINFRDIRAVDKIITQDNETNKQPSSFDQDLAALTAEYDTALEIFQNLENIDYGSSKIVSQSAQPARCLTVKMLLLAKQIQERPPKPNNPQRVLISIKLQQLRKQFNNSPANSEDIKRQVAEQIDKWIQVNTAEKKMLEDAVSKLVTAADTGRQLSKLIDDYANISFEIMATRITQILGVTTTLSGRDYSSILIRMKTVESAINQDKTLKDFVREVSFNRRQPEISKAQLCQ
ncbi:hypothetical protein [Nostoc sp. TCL26-01]|uniref:hypothetical protein n=1 Tax=Nostoc sp. TCL26-01 TaxID=2576904 RepID=UPI0015BC5346|nr:hypothetical protein [Nostoc sp. TCL26-01]QLE57880.1 hypothetical protein FD725_21590 [Nostoc sp. TCL26-01]